MLDIPATGTLPVQFDGKAHIRVGSATPPLRKFPQREGALMAKLRPFVWEEGVARAFVTAEQVLRLLDHGACLSLLGHPPPMEQAGILDRMAEGRLIARDVGGRWSILNPDIRFGDGGTRVVLYAPRDGMDALTRTEWMRACYQHSALLYEDGHRLTNTSLRDRFGPDEARVDAASRVIRDCLDAGLIRIADPVRPKSGYIPYWT